MNILIPHDLAELHSALCMRVVFSVRGYVETKCLVSYSFDFISGAHESKEGYLLTPHFVRLTNRSPIPHNNVGMLKPRVGLGPNLIEIDLKKCF